MISAPVLMLFAEDALCAHLARDLADREFARTDIDWLREVMDSDPSGARTWGPILPEHGEWTSRSDLKGAEVRLHEIDLDDREGRIVMALKARKLAALRRRELGKTPCALVIAIDADGVEDLRDRIEAHLARLAEGAARGARPLVVALALPDPESEAWVIAGFDPANAAEQERHADTRRDLTFDPVVAAHRLLSTTGDRRDAKKVAERLLGARCEPGLERAKACWTETPLEVLEARGEQNGLRAYLRDVRERLIPVLEGRGSVG